MSFLKQAISQKHGPNDTLFLSTKKGLSITPKITGVTLLSVLGKLFTRILTSWAESLNVYIEAQAGFRSGMSISDNIFVLTWYNYTYDKSRKKLYCSFIDFSKAFDYVERNSLWSKLIKLGIRGKMMTILKSMYSSVKSRVRFNNKLSLVFRCPSRRVTVSFFMFNVSKGH